MYEWIKALHVIAVISWMAGMLYLPRLFVYHCKSESGSQQSRANRYLPLLRRIVSAIIAFTGFVALLEVWGVDAIVWFYGDIASSRRCRATVISRARRAYVPFSRCCEPRCCA
jgi:protoporphyrinogen IX oxidase